MRQKAEAAKLCLRRKQLCIWEGSYSNEDKICSKSIWGNYEREMLSPSMKMKEIAAATMYGI